ncbi:MAG: cytochrome C biogenesis protein [Dehalococcoidia bacterium]|nr:cytochrome C biogenesis protein [Dehalococcoidia bacterium]
MSETMAVFRKDLRLAWRDRSAWLSAAAFAAITVLTYSFAFDLATQDVRPLLPGVLWTTFLFAGILANGQSFQREAEQGTLDAMLLSPVSPTAIYVGKVLTNVVGLLTVEVAVLLLATILFGTTLLTLELSLIVFVGTIGYVSLTTLLATLGSRARARAVLLPVLALPLLVPMLIAAVRATGASLGDPVGTAPWMLLLVVFAMWTSIGGALLFPMVTER